MYTKEEAKQLRLSFWEGFGRYCDRDPRLSGKKKKWVLYDTGIRHVDLKFEVGRQDAKVILEINHKNESKKLEWYEKIEPYKSILEADFPDGLTWDYLYTLENGKEVCRIYTQQLGFDFHRQHQWEDIYKFFLENMLKLENGFMEIRDFIKED